MKWARTGHQELEGVEVVTNNQTRKLLSLVDGSNESSPQSFQILNYSRGKWSLTESVQTLLK